MADIKITAVPQSKIERDKDGNIISGVITIGEMPPNAPKYFIHPTRWFRVYRALQKLDRRHILPRSLMRRLALKAFPNDFRIGIDG